MTNIEPNKPGREVAELPFVDEHSRRIDAVADDVWDALISQVAQFDNVAARSYARLVGARPVRGTGPFPQLDASLPGFAVSDVEPPRKLVLAGRHIFARYSLTFTLEPQEDSTLVRAVTHSRFPGIHGSVYRVAVIGSRGHRLALQRLLASVEKTACSGSGLPMRSRFNVRRRCE